MTAPTYVAVDDWTLTSFDPGANLPKITANPSLISDQPTLDAVLISAGKNGVRLKFSATGSPTPPPATVLVKTVAGQSPTIGGDVPLSGVALALASLKVGGAPQGAFTVELGQDNDGIVSDMSFVRIRARGSRGSASPASFYGVSALRLEIEDTANVIDDASTPYLYGLRVRAVPRRSRHVTAVDDLVGVVVTNQSFTQLGTAFNGTEAVYIGWGGGSTGSTGNGLKDWNAGVGIDTVADKGMYIVRGPYDYGILITAPCTTAALRIPNNAPIVGRNPTDTGSNDMLRVDTNGNVRVGSASVKVVVGVPNQDTDVTQPFEVHSTGATDGNLGHSHVRVVDTQAFAAGVGGAIGFAGQTDSATPRTIRTFGAIAGRKANATSTNAAGYLSLYSRNASTGLVEVLRLTELQKMQVTDGVDILLGSTTGTKLGSATTERLGFWGATPITRPAITGSRGGNAAVASLLTQLAAAGLITDSTTA
jgi:hypothetical protein